MAGPLTPSDLPRSWHTDWSGLSIAVLGLGPGGFSAADTLVEKGVATRVFASTADSDRQAILGVVGVDSEVHSEANALVASIEQANPDVVVLGGSRPIERHAAEALRQAGVVVWSLVELTVRLADKVPPACAQVFVAGGQEAKEVVEIAGDFLDAAGIRAAGAGGSFPPALDPLRLPEGLDVLLWCVSEEELLDMALDYQSARSPRVSVALGRQSVVGEALVALYHQTSQACIYRRHDETERAVEEAWVIEGARAIGIGLDSPGMSDLGVVEDIVCDRAFLDDRKNRALELTTLGELAEAGYGSPREVEIVLTAAAIARCFGVTPEIIGGVLRDSAVR